MLGNRGIYHDGWTAVTRHSIPWDVAGTPPKFSEDKWELYNTNDDFSQSQDLAAKYPDKLRNFSASFSQRQKSTTSCRSTTGVSSALCRQLRAGLR